MTDPTSFSVFTESPQIRPLKDRVVESLRQKGYAPTDDDDGDISVVVQGQQVFVRTLDTQPPLLRVFGQWLIGQEVPGDLLLRLNAANAVTSALNLVKATVHEDRLVVAVDLVVSDGLALPSLMTATLDAIVVAVQTWHATVLELARTDDDQEQPSTVASPVGGAAAADFAAKPDVASGSAAQTTDPAEDDDPTDGTQKDPETTAVTDE